MSDAETNWPSYLRLALAKMNLTPDAVSKQPPALRVYGFLPNNTPAILLGLKDTAQVRPEVEENNERILPSALEPERSDTMVSNEDGSVDVETREGGVTASRRFTPVGTPDNPAYAENVAVLQLAELAQRHHDEARTKNHVYQRERRDKSQRRKVFIPIEGELVDYEAVDRLEKLNTAWKSVFIVSRLSRDRFSVYLRNYDVEKKEPFGREFQAYVGQIRPTLHFVTEKRKSYAEIVKRGREER